MWTLVWIFLILPAGQQGKMEMNKSFASKEDCEALVEAYQERMPDWVLGRLNLPFEAKALVQGVCRAKETPA